MNKEIKQDVEKAEFYKSAKADYKKFLKTKIGQIKCKHHRLNFYLWGMEKFEKTLKKSKKTDLEKNKIRIKYYAKLGAYVTELINNNKYITIINK